MNAGRVLRPQWLLARLARARPPAAIRRSACCALGLLAAALPAAEAPADLALEPAGRAPAFLTNAAVLAPQGLAATAAGGRLRVTWAARGPATDAAVTLWTSTDAPGHWPSRDWRPVAMTRQGGAWAAELPLRSAVVPVVYFAQAAGGVTPMRIFHPARAGVAEPPAAAWTFLEGFEEGHEGWELATGAREAPPLERASPGATGRGALAVTVPPGRASVAVNTTALRGWMLLEAGPGATLRLAARTDAGPGRLRVWLATQAGAPEFVRHEGPGAWEVGPEWRRFEVPLAAFQRLRPGEVDRVTFEFAGRAGQRLLLDDVELVPED